jgi:hypothetical protein
MLITLLNGKLIKPEPQRRYANRRPKEKSIAQKDKQIQSTNLTKVPA